ncbi:hypothetical protein CIHG_05372 [Coccidioides immitis H538.4]|uniref:Uncharacterized protein n=1 Tax=Coccidioides immitis H538.4 TaxID=396776 RepID=A0A0J8RUE3_COCIT|nr:hypothetical protein CIHG_05372 [Coccidioides immitis H538.4]
MVRRVAEHLHLIKEIQNLEILLKFGQWVRNHYLVFASIFVKQFSSFRDARKLRLLIEVNSTMVCFFDYPPSTDKGTQTLPKGWIETHSPSTELQAFIPSAAFGKLEALAHILHHHFISPFLHSEEFVEVKSLYLQAIKCCVLHNLQGFQEVYNQMQKVFGSYIKRQARLQSQISRAIDQFHLSMEISPSNPSSNQAESQLNRGRGS